MRKDVLLPCLLWPKQKYSPLWNYRKKIPQYSLEQCRVVQDFQKSCSSVAQCETRCRPITCIVCQRTLAPRWPSPPGPVCKGQPVWRRPRGRPRSSWLGHVSVSCREERGIGREPVTTLTHTNPREWRISNSLWSAAASVGTARRYPTQWAQSSLSLIFG